MKKSLKVFSLVLLFIIFITGCNIGTKNLTYSGKNFNVTFKVLNKKNYDLVDDKTVNISEKKVLLGNGYRIGIEEDDDISISTYNGDFNKYMNNFKDETDFKEVTYNGLKGFQKYYSAYNRYEIYLPVNEKVCLKLNIYSLENTKEDSLKQMKSKEVQNILNSISIKTK